MVHSAKFLSFGHHFNQPIHQHDLPPSVTSITFCGVFNHDMSGLPSSLIFLNIRTLKSPFVNFSPLLTHLTIEGHISDPIDNLPASLTYLSIEGRIDHPLKLFPSSLIELKLMSYAHPLDNLPSSLTNLKISTSHYPHNLLFLPPSLKILSTPLVYKRQTISFPPSLTELDLPDTYAHGMNLNSLPSSLLKLKVNVSFGRVAGVNFDRFITQFPPLLTHLSIAKYNKHLPILPSSLLYLEIAGYNQFLPSLSNTSLISITLSNPFNQPLPALPETLKRLKVEAEFNHPVISLIVIYIFAINFSSQR